MAWECSFRFFGNGKSREPSVWRPARNVVMLDGERLQNSKRRQSENFSKATTANGRKEEKLAGPPK